MIHDFKRETPQNLPDEENTTAHPLNAYAAEAHRIAVEHGWWSDDDGAPIERNMGEMIANIHDEASEAWRDWLSGKDFHSYHINLPDDKEVPDPNTPVGQSLRMVAKWANAATMEGGDSVEPLDPKYLNVLVDTGVAKPVGVDSELADILIRVLDLLHYRQINVDALVTEKMRYNNARPYRHGGKRA